MNVNINVDLSKNWTLSELNDEIYRWNRPQLIVIGILLPFGYVCNSLVIFANIKLVRQRKTASKVLVLYLALADLASSIVLGPLSIYESVSPLGNNADIWCQLQRFCMDFFFFSSLFTLLMIAFERYNRICRTLNKQLSHSTAAWLVVGITIVVTVYSLPHGIHAQVMEFLIKENLSAHICWQDIRSSFHYHYLVNFTFLIIVSILITILYALLWFRLAKYCRKAQDIDQQKETYHPRRLYFSSRKSFIEMTITILSVIVLYAFSYIPNSMLEVLCPLEHTKPNLTKDITHQIMDLNWLISHAFNPCLYGFCDGKVRLKCHKLFPCQDPESEVKEDIMETSIL